MPALEGPINMGTVRARQAQDRMRMAAMDAYEAYLISRSRGVRSAIQPAWGCWRRAEQMYLATCNPTSWTAPGKPETLRAARAGAGDGRHVQ